jgi:hypothetical protein
MPRVPDQLLTNVFYLYESRAAANAGRKAGGTGFLVGVKSIWGPLDHHIYAVSNQHVITSSPVIRLNTISGQTKNILLDPTDWEPHPNGDDIAVVPLERRGEFETEDIDVTFIPEDVWVKNQKRIDEMQIGIGDDVFMIGRFMPHDGQLRNAPSVRFGHISMMPDANRKISQPTRGGFKQESYCVDMHSLFGYSGSPVFIYRAASQGMVGLPHRIYFKLLGVNWGSLWDQIKDEERNKEVEMHGGITGVVPAWKLWELLHTEKFVKQREEEVELFMKKFPSAGGGAKLESAESDPVAKVRDETLRTMLSTPPQPRKQHAKKRVRSK